MKWIKVIRNRVVITDTNTLTIRLLIEDFHHFIIIYCIVKLKNYKIKYLQYWSTFQASSLKIMMN